LNLSLAAGLTSTGERTVMGTRPLLLPVRLRMTHGLAPETIRDLKHLRDGIQLALAHAQASKDKEKFVLPLKEYRRAVDLVLTVRRLDV
jgi:hypothetical protein